MMNEIEAAYSTLYNVKDPLHVYPVEFVVRAFLGRYPRLDRAVPSYRGMRALDLGFGDGRNIPLLVNLGMDVHGVEISESICSLTIERMKRFNITIDARVGKNNSIPYPDQYFDQVLACHSCYYVEPGTSFVDNIREFAWTLACLLLAIVCTVISFWKFMFIGGTIIFLLTGIMIMMYKVAIDRCGLSE